jgi:hypothetical protein
MKHLSAILAALVLALTTAQAQAEGWMLEPGSGTSELRLVYSAGDTPNYVFACEATAIRVTNFGVTELLDLQTGQKVGDGADAVMTPGASLMALFTGKGQPDFLPAESVHNAATGWDMTIRLPKGDKQLKILEKSDMVSLFTTGYTRAVGLSRDDRALAKDFLKQCG